jgi:hypothetical protein
MIHGSWIQAVAGFDEKMRCPSCYRYGAEPVRRKSMQRLIHVGQQPDEAGILGRAHLAEEIRRLRHGRDLTELPRSAATASVATASAPWPP